MMQLRLTSLLGLKTTSSLAARKNFGFARRRSGRLCFSSESSLESASRESTTIESPLGVITRHGQGDGVIVLNVGGKEFKTLRSTVAFNSVLAEHVARAEANQELTSGGSAVFIDREPTQFGVILQYLRNRMDNVTFTSSYKRSLFNKDSSKVYAEQFVQLPKDTKVLRAIYVEACHFEMTDLKDALCRQTFLTNIASTIGGGNPFDAANNFAKLVRRGFVAIGGLGTMMVGIRGANDSNRDDKSWDMDGLVETTRKFMEDTK